MDNFLKKKTAICWSDSPPKEKGLNRMIFQRQNWEGYQKDKPLKTWEHNSFIEEFHPTFLKQIVPILRKLFQGI